MWVQPDAADPLRNQSGVLPRCHAASGPAPCEEEIAGFLWRGSQIIIDSLPCGFCELEPHRSARLPLSYSCSIDRIPAGRNVLELQRDNVALVARAIPLAGPTSATASGGCERRSKHSRSPTIDHPLTSLGPGAQSRSARLRVFVEENFAQVLSAIARPFGPPTQRRRACAPLLSFTRIFASKIPSRSGSAYRRETLVHCPLVFLSDLIAANLRLFVGHLRGSTDFADE